MIAEALKHMLAAGMDHDKIVAAVRDMEASLSRDETAEKRRAWDRERKAAKKAANNSTGIPPESTGTERNPVDASASRARSISSSSLRSEEYSVASATGTDVPSSYPADPVERLWAEGVDAMRAMGSGDREARSNIGRWLRDQRGDAVAVLGAIIQARTRGTKDPVPLVSRILKPAQSNGQARDLQNPRSVHAAIAELDDLANGRSSPFDYAPSDAAGAAPARLLSQDRGGRPEDIRRDARGHPLAISR